MGGPLVRVEWTTAVGTSVCPGCDQVVPAGRRALRFSAGPRGTDRLMGQVFHGHRCLERRAGDCALDEEGRRPDRAEGYREVERWAREEDRARGRASAGARGA